MRRLQMFAAVHGYGYNHFNRERSHSSRDMFKANRSAALAESRVLWLNKRQLHCPGRDCFEFA